MPRPSAYRVMVTVYDESFASEPLFVTLNIVLLNNNEPLLQATPTTEVRMCVQAIVYGPLVLYYINTHIVSQLCVY